MRRAFLAGLAALMAAAALPFPAQAEPTALEGPERTRTLAEASAALNEQRLLQGRFRQVAPDGSITTGRFFLQRPGRVRFEYDPPAPLLIVADGSVVAIQDRALRSTNRSPLRATPLYFVLKDNINLNRDVRVTRVEREGETLYVSARDRTGEADGELILRLDGPDFALRAWDVVDATGARTRFALIGVSSPDVINPAAFRAPPSTAVSPRGPGR
jgi:outer membrane lipoprotein-sorting protein